MNQITLLLLGAIYAVFTQNLLFSGGLGASEVVRVARRNSEMVLTSTIMSGFAATAGVLSVLATELIGRQRDNVSVLHWRYMIFSVQYPSLHYVWHAVIFALILLVLYVLVNIIIKFVPVKIKHKPLLHKHMGMSALNTLVIGVPLLIFRRGDAQVWNMQIWSAIGWGLGAGLAFYFVTMLINSGMHILQQNKAIPPMFTGVPATLIYTGLLALAFTGFAGGGVLF